MRKLENIWKFNYCCKTWTGFFVHWKRGII